MGIAALKDRVVITVNASVSGASLGWAKASLIALAAMLMTPLASVASGSPSGDPLAIDAPCSGPASTPVCALRTLHRCYEQRDASLCALIGVAGVDFDLMATYEAQFPSGSEKGADRSDRIVGVREVGPERFAVHNGSHFIIEDHMIGTHEVMEKLDICAHGPCLASASYFFKRMGDRWILTSWTDNAAICLGVGEGFQELFPHCAMQIPVPTWTDL